MFQHKELAAGRWEQMSLAEQMLNIGSEISRANNWRSKSNTDQMTKAVYRALELIDLTIVAQNGLHSLKEFTRLREVVCDFYLGDNEYHSDGEWLQKYFDSFFYQHMLKQE